MATDVIYKCTVLSPEKPFQEAIMLINFYCEIMKQSIDGNSLTSKQQRRNVLCRNVCNNITHLPEDCEIHELTQNIN